MAKPAIDDTRFGETVGGATGNIAAPASGTKDTGYPDNATPPAKEHSWLWNRAHRWFKYIDALIDDADKWTFPGAVKVTTDLDCGTLTVQGATSLKDDTTVSTGKKVILQGTGKVVQNATLQFPFNLDNDNLAPFKTIDNAHQFVIRAFDLPLGTEIKACRVIVKDNATGAQTLGAQLEAWTLAPANTHVAGMGVTNGSGTVQTLTTGAISFIVATGETWSVAVFYNGGAATQTCQCGSVELDVRF